MDDNFTDGERDLEDLHDQSEWNADDYSLDTTPTTEAIRATYATDYWMAEVRGIEPELRARAFDRWLAARDAAKWDEGRAVGWIDGRTGVDGDQNPYRVEEPS